MKKISLLLTTIALVGFLYSCSNQAEEEKQPQFIRMEPIEESNNDDNKSKEKKEPKSIVECKKEEKKEALGPILVKTCKYRNIKTISEGYPDMKGRYSYNYEVMLNDKKVKNEDIFNNKSAELLGKLNQKILKDYTTFYNAEETKDCFDGMPKNPTFSFNDMGIDFEDDKINFNVIFGLPGMCMSVDGTIISLSLEEIEPYLKK
jgi:hypothetical protein